jgi:hypothetical protein
MSDFDWSPFEGDRWQPESIGDTIKGQIVDIEAKNIGGDLVPVVTITVEDGSRKEIRCSTDLKRKLAKENPQIGDMLAVKMTDLKHTGQPQPMKVFAVRVQRNNQTPAPQAPEPDAASSAASLQTYDSPDEEPF